MKEIEIKDVTNIVNTIANSLFADIRTKELAQNSLMKLVGLSCQKYHQDELFRAQMDHITTQLMKSKPLQDPLKRVSPRR